MTQPTEKPFYPSSIIQKEPGDPVFQKISDGKWYHADECWSDMVGPFATEEEAREALKAYCVWLSGACT